MISGKLISSKDQKITLQVALKHESLSVDDNVVGFSSEKYTTPALGPTVTIPSSSILYIEKSGKRKLRSQSTGNTIGAIFTVLGLAHLASSPIAYINDGDSGNLLLALGAAELTTGLIVGFTFDNRPLITNQDCPKWSEGKKLWEIQ